ncbi:hypothetical protein N7471_004267 [Penicillium samsonianum]|uniref:uncharacterized protein n=1 Tax=Penicillium samsonianum TaxID=1882272 RepID=UPI0025466D63|nr:uncharacterized protein N7471_004267 [Penicillium samsonianum]KAJ6137781.1 hypothetical protein N7471_004267 [Penicillium samsonianum]
MVGKMHVALLGLFGITSAFASGTKLRRDETPKFPHDPEATSSCSWWRDNDGSVACKDMPSTWGISMEEFLRWNPSITASCGNFLTDHSYCVEVFGEPDPQPMTTKSSTTAASTTGTSTTVTPTTVTSPNDIATPTPTRPGTVSNCQKFHKVIAGDTCSAILQSAGITLTQLVKNNPGIKSDCSNLLVDYYICISILGVDPTPTTTKPTTPTNGITTPTPILPGPGMVNNCDAFHLVVNGDRCGNIAHKYGISMAQFTQYNPEMKTDCSNLLVGYYVCVSIIGVDPKPTTTTTAAGNGIATPTPTSAGMASNCDAFYEVKPGDKCGKIARQYGITTEQLSKWNTEIGSNCSGLRPGYYICVSVVGVDPKPTTTTTKGNEVTTPTTTTTTKGNEVTTLTETITTTLTITITTTEGNEVTTPTTTSTKGNEVTTLTTTTEGNEVTTPTITTTKGNEVTTLTTTVTTTLTTTITTTLTTTITTTKGNEVTTPTTTTKDNEVTTPTTTTEGNEVTTPTTTTEGNEVTTPTTTTEGNEVTTPATTTTKSIGLTTLTTTTKGNGATTPTPIQAGIIGTCTTFYKVGDKDTCEVITKAAGITLTDFYNWNKGVGSGCKSLWLLYYVCIGVI